MDRFLRLLFILSVVIPLSAQNNPSPQLQPRSAEPAQTSTPPPDRQIQLDVQVTDKSGAPVRGLQKQDFTLLDDKRPQEILSFQAVDRAAPANNDRPTEVVLVVDAVNAPFQAVTYERTELKKFLLQNGGKLAVPTSLIVFSDTGTEIQKTSSRDGNALAALYDQYETGLRIINRSQGFWGAAERFEMSLKTLNSFVEYEKSRPGRKLMVWFSPGWPLLSGPNIELSRKQEEHFFDSIVSASNGLRQARITLYSIDPLGLADAGGTRITYYKEFVKGVTSANRAMPANLSLQVLTVQSGGRVLNSSNDLTSELAHCVSDTDAFYVLSFQSARADRANEYHAISISVDKPQATARTRTGYYAQPYAP
ncbi:MAG: VWA domain-containing protein [Candidatus Sulfotelmatobacter sp.]